MLIRFILVFCAFFSLSALAKANDPVLLVVGDSLSAGYGIERSKGWVELLQRKLQTLGYRYSVVNASISGDTTTNGQYRLAALLEKHQPEWVLIELGGNDGLRGVQVPASKAALNKMIEQVQQQSRKVMLIGIELPPNYGELYNNAIRQMFVELATQHQLPFLPFLLAGVAENEGWVQADGIHPTEAAQPTILENVWLILEPTLEKTE